MSGPSEVEGAAAAGGVGSGSRGIRSIHRRAHFVAPAQARRRSARPTLHRNRPQRRLSNAEGRRRRAVMPRRLSTKILLTAFVNLLLIAVLLMAAGALPWPHDIQQFVMSAAGRSVMDVTDRLVQDAM